MDDEPPIGVPAEHESPPVELIGAQMECDERGVAERLRLPLLRVQREVRRAARAGSGDDGGEALTNGSTGGEALAGVLGGRKHGGMVGEVLHHRGEVEATEGGKESVDRCVG
jgi:hypothetical protein